MTPLLVNSDRYDCYECGAHMTRNEAFMRVSDGFYFCEFCITARVNQTYNRG